MSNTREALQPGGIDVAIRYGPGPFPATESTHLCDDRILPVCHPGLAVSIPDDLLGATLIHIDGRSRPRPQPDWAQWCALADVRGLDTQAGPRFPDSMLAVQAAIAGQGIMLASRVLVGDALASGLLKAPFPQSLAGDAYHFACAPGLEDRPDVAALRGWFRAALK